MLFRFVFVVLILACGQNLIAQPTATPTPASRGGSSVIGDNARYDRLRAVEMEASKHRPGSHPLLDPKKGIYRRPGKEETQALSVSESLVAEYRAFLNGPNTGIVKLSVRAECVSDTDKIVADDACIPYKFPGAGIAYSFRTESYRLPRLADIILHEGVFKTGGAFQQVAMADIGNVAIEDVTLDTRGIKYLLEFEPIADSDQFTRMEDLIIKGIERDGFLYRKGHLVKENSTYVLRSIAYRGKYMRSVDGVPYDELDLDRRRDAIVAFRVVEKDPAGNITIVWKRLRDLEAPKLKILR